jgi:hypothetical protein
LFLRLLGSVAHARCRRAGLQPADATDVGQEVLAAGTSQGRKHRSSRGEKQVGATSPVVGVVDWLRAETGGVVSAVAFTVEAKR